MRLGAQPGKWGGICFLAGFTLLGDMHRWCRFHLSRNEHEGRWCPIFPAQFLYEEVKGEEDARFGCVGHALPLTPNWQCLIRACCDEAFWLQGIHEWQELHSLLQGYFYGVGLIPFSLCFSNPSLYFWRLPFNFRRLVIEVIVWGIKGSWWIAEMRWFSWASWCCLENRRSNWNEKKYCLV